MTQFILVSQLFSCILNALMLHLHISNNNFPDIFLEYLVTSYPVKPYFSVKLSMITQTKSDLTLIAFLKSYLPLVIFSFELNFLYV